MFNSVPVEELHALATKSSDAWACWHRGIDDPVEMRNAHSQRNTDVLVTRHFETDGHDAD